MHSISSFSEIQRCPLVIRMTDGPFEKYGTMAGFPTNRDYTMGETLSARNVSLLLI